MAQNLQLFGPREGFLTHQRIITGNKYITDQYYDETKMMIRQKQRVATDTWRSLGCRTTPLEHWCKRKPTVEPWRAKQLTPCKNHGLYARNHLLVENAPRRRPIGNNRNADVFSKPKLIIFKTNVQTIKKLNIPPYGSSRKCVLWLFSSPSEAIKSIQCLVLNTQSHVMGCVKMFLLSFFSNV